MNKKNLSKTYRAENGMLIMGLQSFAEDNLTSTGNESFAGIEAQNIDFVNRFGGGIAGLKKLLDIQRVIPIASGGMVKTYTSSVTLDDTPVPAGAIIPLSQVKTEAGEPIELVWDKKRKAVPAEDIQLYGYERAVALTDTALIKELQKEVRNKLFANLKKGTGTVTGEGLQQATAQAWGAVSTVFEDDEPEVIGFLNTMDVADYLGNAEITIQTAFGMNYIENFMGFKVAMITSQVDKGELWATASENLVLAHANMGGDDVSRVFDFYTDETGLIGVTHTVNKQRLTAETVTASAVALFAERLDGVVKATITEAGA